MKVTLFMMFVCAFQLVASTGKAQNAVVKLSSNTVTVKTLFTEIEKQTDYLMSFPEKEIDQTATVTLKDKEGKVNEILDDVLEGTNLGYEYTNNYIVISKKVETTKAVQQNGRTVTGVVKDKNGEPIIGANVIVKGTTNGAITDFDGRFSLEVPANATLHISYVGYAEQDVAVGNQRTLNITMSEDTEALEELVVVGYGSQKKSDLTGSVASVSAKDLEGLPASSANNILSGRAAGVSVRSASGNPAASTTSIRIRGANSIYGGNDPLIVVNGNYADELPHTDDIASLEILKDASATAIYGSRGANGVIIVTTKRGKEGKLSVRVNANMSITQSNRYDLMEAGEFVSFNKQAGTHPFTDADVSLWKSNPGTNWQDEILRTGIAQDYKVSVSGGTEFFKYYISPSYTKRQGVMKNSEADAVALSSNFDMKFSDRISLKMEFNAGRKTSLNSNFGVEVGPTSAPLYAALLWSPTEPVYDEDGGLNQFGIGTGTTISPALMISCENNWSGNYANAAGTLQVKLLEGLRLDLQGKVGYNADYQKNFRSAQYTATNAEAGQSTSEITDWLINAVLSYNKTFGEAHNFSAMAGYEYTRNVHENFSANANILPMESHKWYNLGSAAPNISVGSGFYNTALLSYFGRLNYNYKSRYYVTANFRADGSSKFRDGKRFGYFPSFSLAWRLSEEAFLKDQEVFQNIKLRGGWGQTGNQGVSAYATYAGLRSWGYSWGTGSESAGYNPIIGGNPNLTWETTTQTNVGLDFSVLDNRISVSLDWYKKKTTDLLAPVSVPGYNGGDSEYGRATITSNVGSVENTGFEFNVNADLIRTKDFSWNANLNGAFNKNKVIDLGENDIIWGQQYAHGSLGANSPFVLMEGEAIGSVYGLKYLGIWQENEAAEAAKFGQTPGDYHYEDLNGDHSYGMDDYQILGKTNPDFTWGFNNQLSYKNWNFNVMFEGSHGRKVMNWTYLVMNEPVMSNTFIHKDATDRWSSSNPNAQFAKIGNTHRLNANSDQYLENADYVKLRNISVGYTIPRKVTKFADIQLSFSAQNLLTFTGYKGFDPEVSTTAGDDTNSGMDWFAYPNPRSFSFGLSIAY